MSDIDKIHEVLVCERKAEIRQEILWGEHDVRGECWFNAYQECRESLDEAETLRQMLIILRRKHRQDYSTLGNLVRQYCRAVEKACDLNDDDMIREQAENDLQEAA